MSLLGCHEHGFSRVHGLFLRGHTKQSGSHDLMINDLSYSQLEPSIYKTEDDFSMYSLDVYSKHPQTKKMLSNTYSDLLYVPYYKHLPRVGRNYSRITSCNYFHYSML